MHCRIGNRDHELLVRSRALSNWCRGSVVLAILVVFGSALAQEQPPKHGSLPHRQAKRPPSARIQTNLKLASKTKVEFRQPVELAYKDFNELVLQAGTFENGNGGELGGPSKFQLLCYNGQPVGPTIRVRRGTTFHIRLKNNLPAQEGAKTHPVGGLRDRPHDLCTTNLHTHGLHVSPTGNADNIFIAIKPQEEFTFEFTVPANHPSGTFWYHPHRHGSVAYQLANGLGGALIVEGSRHDDIADLEDIPEIAAAKERILVLQLYNYRVDPPGQEGVARIDTSTIYDIAPDVRACPALAVPEEKPREKGQATAINGLITPIIRMAPGEVQRWRLIHAGWDINRQLFLGDADGKPATDLQFFEIALDGLATGTMVAKGNSPNDSKTPALEIAAGQRSDVLIRAPLVEEGKKERIYYLLQSGRDQPIKENLILAKILVGGKPRLMHLPDPRVLAKCQPFAGIQDKELATTDTSEFATKGIQFNVISPDRFLMNAKTFTQYQTPVQIRLNTAEQWTVTATGADHPFHLHVNPFQVLMRKDAKGKCTPMNVWRDTLFLREGESFTIRTRFQDFLGKTAVHCHFLDHEDEGMMLPIEFIPPYQTPKLAVVAQHPSLKPTTVRAPALKLADPNGKWHDLAEFRPRPIVLVFFQGMECSHCTEELATFVREARALIDSGIEIVAVSNRRIADPGRALKTLGVGVTDRFTVLVDEECQAFRTFGCYKEGPRHGLFLIDRSGTICASYTGETPFDDVQAVADWVKSLGDTGPGKRSR